MKKFAACLIILLLSSCTISYKFNGASINYNLIKTISVSDFPIRAALVYPPLSEVFTNSLKDAYTQQTALQMVDVNGDLQVEGEITGYDLSPQCNRPFWLSHIDCTYIPYIPARCKSAALFHP